jgi:hypothetical protein
MQSNLSHLACAAIVSIAFGSIALGQGGSPPALQKPDQATDLLSGASDQKLTAEQEVELSRLLAQSDDQINWLLSRVDALQKGRDSEGTRLLARAARTRATVWQSRGVDTTVAVDTLDRILAILAPLVEIVDPAALAERLKTVAAAELTALSIDDKFTLFARGVAESRLALPTNAPDAWARRAGANLAAADNLPAVGSMLTLANRAPSNTSAGANSPPAQLAAACVAALLNRGLGCDSLDHGGPHDAQGNQAANEPAYWQDLAVSLESRSLWRWAALCRILQATSTPDPAARKLAAQAADDSWKSLRIIDPQETGSWRGVDQWLNRLDDDSLLAKAGALPLADDFRASARSARTQLEQQFLAAWAARNEAESFRLMQLAKAAAAGITGPSATVTLDELRSSFGTTRGEAVIPTIHLFLELLAVKARDTLQYYGIAIHSETASLGTDDRFVSAMLGPAASPADIVRDTLGRIQRRTNTAKLIVCPDGDARTADWFTGGGEAELLGWISPTRATESWLVYAPTAAAARDGSGWTADLVAKEWRRAGLLAGHKQLGVLLKSDPGAVDSLRTVGSPTLPTTTDLCPLYIGSEFPTALQRPPASGWTGYLGALLLAKSGAAKQGAALLVPKRS